MKPEIRRCAVYTRKSSEEGLDQEFNSLDAQREAGEAYVKSQSNEGWRLLPARYDDGGFSGGSMERPGLRRLLADIDAGLIDVVVVYKIDRLTRSLTDFARMVELFDRRAVSFVSVTQAFNTTSSMGRLTLNVLLSFAQFEREVTGERIRDKIAASKAKGMWMGGMPPLGYDPPTNSSLALVVNKTEAEIVRSIFSKYVALASVHALQHWLEEQAIRSKQRITRSGKALGGQPFSRGALFHLLRNRTYLGLIVHKDKCYPGAHAAIVDAGLFAAVQSQLDLNARRQGARSDRVARAPLTGRIFDSGGEPMSPSFSHGARGQVYRYYVSSVLQQGVRRGRRDGIHRVPAAATEKLLGTIMHRLLPDQSHERLSLLIRVEIHASSLQLLMPVKLLARLRERVSEDEQVERDHDDPTLLRLTIPIRMQLRGGRTCIIGGEKQPTRRDPVLIKALRSAQGLLQMDGRGLPRLQATPTSPYLAKLVRLALLAPDIQEAILAGRQPPGLTLEQLVRGQIPPRWSEQRRVFGFAAWRTRPVNARNSLLSAIRLPVPVE